MCGRYYIDVEDRELQDIFLQAQLGQALRSGNIRPGDLVPVRDASGLRPMRWGYSGRSRLTINARFETAGETALFRSGMEYGRCLIPASWYYEWEETRTERIQYRLRPHTSGCMWMAGLCRPGLQEPEFVILTREAAPDIAFVHSRMPLILPSESWEPWLHGQGDISPIFALHAEPTNGQLPSLFLT